MNTLSSQPVISLVRMPYIVLPYDGLRCIHISLSVRGGNSLYASPITNPPKHTHNTKSRRTSVTFLSSQVVSYRLTLLASGSVKGLI